MTELPTDFGPWLNVKLDGLALIVQDTDDAGSDPELRTLWTVLTLTPNTTVNAVIPYDGIGYIPATKKWAIGPEGFSPPAGLQTYQVKHWPFSENIINLADPDIPTDASSYALLAEVWDGTSKIATLTGTVICPEVPTVPYDLLTALNVVAPAGAEIVQLTVPSDIPDGYYLVKSGAGVVGVEAVGGDSSTLADLTDVDTTGATTGQVLTFDGSGWVSDDAPAGTGGGATVEWVTLTSTAQPITLPTPTQGTQLILVLTQDSVGGRSPDWPSDIVWEGGANPSVPAGPSERAVFTLLGTGSGWLGFLSGMFAAPVVPDTTDPTVGILESSLITSTTFRLTVSGAADDTALDPQPYRFSTDNGSTWSSWQTSPELDYTGMSASTTYTCVHQTRDATGNTVTGASISVETLAGAAPGITDSFDRANSTTGLGQTDTGETWEQVGTGIVGINNNLAYQATSNAGAVVDFGQADMLVEVTVVVNGDYFSGVQGRYVDQNNRYWVDTGSGGGSSARVQRLIAGSQTSVTNSYPLAAGDRIGLSLKEVGGATEVKIIINGEVKQTANDSTAGRPAGTKAGIQPYNNGNIRLNDFAVSVPA